MNGCMGDRATFLDIEIGTRGLTKITAVPCLVKPRVRLGYQLNVISFRLGDERTAISPVEIAEILSVHPNPTRSIKN
jgi:hypothetical protein